MPLRCAERRFLGQPIQLPPRVTRSLAPPPTHSASPLPRSPCRTPSTSTPTRSPPCRTTPACSPRTTPPAPSGDCPTASRRRCSWLGSILKNPPTDMRSCSPHAPRTPTPLASATGSSAPSASTATAHTHSRPAMTRRRPAAPLATAGRGAHPHRPNRVDSTGSAHAVTARSWTDTWLSPTCGRCRAAPWRGRRDRGSCERQPGLHRCLRLAPARR